MFRHSLVAEVLYNKMVGNYHSYMDDTIGTAEQEMLEIDTFLVLEDRLVPLYNTKEALSAADPRTNQMQGVPESLYKAGCI